MWVESRSVFFNEDLFSESRSWLLLLLPQTAKSCGDIVEAHMYGFCLFWSWAGFDRSSNGGAVVDQREQSLAIISLWWVKVGSLECAQTGMSARLI